MLRYIFTLVLLVMPALGLPQEVQQATPARRANPSQPAGVDQFADARAEAQEAEAQWLDANQTLGTRLGEQPPCSPERTRAIHDARDLAFAAIERKAAYYKKYGDVMREQIRRFSKVLADTSGTIRPELQAMATEAEESFKDLQRRKEDLRRSAKSSGVSVEGSLKHLDDLITSAKERLESLRLSFSRLDEAESYGRQSKQHAEALSQTIEQVHLLLQAESGLWDAYYRAVEARTGLDCVVHQRNSFRPFDPRRP
jgi:hypothetical protein